MNGTFLPLLAAALLSQSGVFTLTADDASAREDEDGEMVVHLEGHVVVTDGEVFVRSRSGRVWQNRERAVFFGSVRIEADSLEAAGDTLTYDRRTGVVVLSGHVTLTDSGNVLTASEVTYYREAGKALARDDVVLTGEWLGEVRGDYALYDRERGSLFVTENPVLVRVEDGDTLTVVGDRLEFFPDSGRAEAQGNVVIDIPSEGFTATAEYARYHGNDDLIELIGGPVLASPDGELSGDRQEISLNGREIESVRVDGNARGHFVDTTEDPPGETWMSAQHAYFVFAGGVVDSVAVFGSAEVTVQSGGEGASRAETNTLRGDLLVFSFDEGTLTSVIGSGSVSGTYGYMNRD